LHGSKNTANSKVYNGIAYSLLEKQSRKNQRHILHLQMVQTRNNELVVEAEAQTKGQKKKQKEQNPELCQKKTPGELVVHSETSLLRKQLSQI
jgi:hypothetical protein